MTDDDKAPAAAWFALGILLAVTAFAALDRQVLTITMEPMRKTFGLSDWQLGALQGLGLTLVSAIGSVPLAWLADRFDRRIVLAACVLAWSSATAWRGLAGGFPELMLGTMGLALAEAGLMPIVYAMIPSLFPGRQRAAANLIFYTASQLGFALGLVMAGLVFGGVEGQVHNFPALVQGQEPWRVANYVVALPGIVFVALVMAIRAEYGRATPRAMTDARAKAEPATLLPYLKQHWRALVGVFGSAAACVAALSPVLTWLAPALTRVFGMPPSEVGVRLGIAFGTATLCGVLLASFTVKRWGKRWGDALAIHTGQFLAAGAFIPAALIAVAPSATAALASVFGVGSFIVAFAAVLPGLWQGLAPAALRARVVAIAGMALTLGTAVGPLVVGALSDLLWPNNPRGLLLAIGGVSAPLMLVGALIMRWVRPHLHASLDRIQREPAELAHPMNPRESMP